MKTSRISVRAGLLAAAFLFAGSLAVEAQNTKKPAAKKPAAKAAAKVAAKPAAKKAPKTLAEVFSFLPDTVATVGKKKITKKEFLAQLGNVPVEYIAQLKPEMLKAQATQMIQSLVDAEVILHQAAKVKIRPSKALVMAELDKQFKALPKQQLDMIEKQLTLQKKTLNSYKNELASNPNVQRACAIQKYVQTRIAPKVKVTNAEIQKFYKENQSRFKTPEMVDASHILITAGKDKAADAKAKAKAASILAQLKKGGDFAKIAEKESACNSKRQGGKLGAFTRGQMVPEFEKAAFALTKPGQLSAVVKTQFGYHIIKLNKKVPASQKKLAEVQAFIKENLNRGKIQKAVMDDLAAAKKSLKVTYPAFKK